MERVGWAWRVRPGMADAYDREHAEIWPDLAQLLRDSGVRAFHIHRGGETVFAHLDVDDYARMLDLTSRAAVSVRWEEHMSRLIEYPGDAPQRLRHVWSLPPDAASGP